MLYRISGFCPNSYARQEPPSAVARRTRLRAQSPDPVGASPGGGDWCVAVRYLCKLTWFFKQVHVF